MLEHSLVDRRRNFRAYVNIPLEYEILSSSGQALKKKNGLIKNISAEGVGIGINLEIDEALPLNTELKVSFKLPRKDNLVNATVKIVWVTAASKPRTFFIGGTTFTNLSEADRKDILDLVERLNINKLLRLAIQQNASDLHLVVDTPPILRINGELQMTDLPPLYADEIINLVYSIMDDSQIYKFEVEKELDFGIQFDPINRFRVNLHQQRGFLEVALRLISAKHFSFEELRIPEVTKELARQKDGLILVVGPTGSGKTTTMAAMVELINNERKAVIITLERPIEYVHTNLKSIIKQREIGLDTESFSRAIKSSLRQDPNVIVVGELEDMETVKTALIAAEAGYLVIASFHAPSSVQAIDRLASIFPVESRRQILAQVANCIRGMIFQLLIPRKDKTERVLASEVMIGNEAIKSVIRKDDLIQIPTIIQTNALYKMQTMVESIKKYLDEGIIDQDTAAIYAEASGQQFKKRPIDSSLPLAAEKPKPWYK